MPLQVGRNARVVTVAGGNLFALAAEHYGDHTLWSLIARANGLLDPFLDATVRDLVIPDRPASTASNTGVVGA